MSRIFIIAILFTLPLTLSPSAPKKELKVGMSALAITPFGANPAWDGTITETGVRGSSPRIISQIATRATRACYRRRIRSQMVFGSCTQPASSTSSP